MKSSFVELTQFKGEIKRLSRKYPQLEDDLNRFYQDFLNNPIQNAFATPGFERKLWKTRMRSTDQQKGKSGGFRIIFYFDEAKPDNVYSLAIYPKNEREDLSSSQLWEIYKRFIDFLKETLKGSESKNN